MNTSRLPRLLVRGIGHLLWPWPSIRRTVALASRTGCDHVRSFVHLRELLVRPQHDERRAAIDSAACVTGFEAAMAGRPAGAPAMASVERRLLRQKRLALVTAAAIFLLSACAISNGRMLGIATIAATGPLMFMACLSAHFRLWQIRMRRLSVQEHGGLDDFFRGTRWWPLKVLDPEIASRPGGLS